MKNYQEQVLDVVKEAVRIAGNKNQLAEAMGTNRSKIGKWEDGKASPTTKDFAALADYVGAQIVLPGQTVRDFVRLAQLTESDAYQHHAALKNSQNVPVPVLEYVSQHCRRQPSILFLPELLENIGVPVNAAVLYTVHNDAMSPTLHENDLILIDTRQKAVDDGDIYLVHVSDRFFVRRLSKDIMSGDLLLTADGKAAPQSIAAANLHTVDIIGKAVWVGKKL